MRAIEISQPGGPEVLRLVERPRPEPGSGELLIRVEAAGVNRPDILQREGLYPPPPGASDLPGLEVAGMVEALGDGVVEWRVGDRVCALVAGGGYAEFCTAPAGQCLSVPAALTTPEAAALPEACCTVWTNMFDRGALAGGEAALVHGGTSGIGTTAIQLAVARGARVFATAGTDEKCRVCERLGADRAINYRSEDFVAVTRELTDGRGVDLILDIVGGTYMDRNLRALGLRGRLVQIGLIGGPTATIEVGRILTRRLTITGSTLRSRSLTEKAAIASAVREWVWPLIDEGRMVPVIDRTFPLIEAAAAHRLMESSRHIGKIILTIS